MSLTYLLPDIDYLIKSLLDLLNKWQATDALSVHVWFFKGILIIYIWYKMRSYIDTELANLTVERAIRKYYNTLKTWERMLSLWKRDNYSFSKNAAFEPGLFIFTEYFCIKKMARLTRCSLCCVLKFHKTMILNKTNQEVTVK